MHILFNMLGVWMFGVELERLWGTQFFSRFYAVTGIGGGSDRRRWSSLLPFAAMRIRPTSRRPIGASGALFGS